MSVTLLKNIYLFHSLSDEQINALSELAEIKRFEPGAPIFKEGDEAGELFIIKYGSVRIYQNVRSKDKYEVSVLTEGSHFGEIPFLDNLPRSASAETIELSEIMSLSYERLNGFISKNSELSAILYLEMAKFLCGRLRTTTQDLNHSREENLKYF